MSAAVNGTESPKKERKRRGRRPRPKLEDGSREAKRLATAVLEVLAGTRTPAEAATTVGVSVPRYYALEAIAIGGLVAACEPRKVATGFSAEAELATLRKAHERLECECARQQALLRITQRTVGLPSPPPRDAKAPGKKKRGRRPRVRALKAIAAIESKHEERAQAAGNEARRAGGRVVAGQAAPEGDS